ncbi:hypothetical protein [Georgenia sp. SUBG003]|uniref:hypothetical protein n=1 Tax=Georgenia sp. SUBG003 TaxID=1497974 RepID=UPI0004D55ECB|nr:hypothetical protein DA06_16595 [Georgenia sp. SUBG003]
MTHGRADHRRLGEAADPPVRQLHLALVVRPVGGRHAHPVGAHLEVHQLGAAQGREGRTQRVVQIDVRGAEADVATVEGLRAEIEAGVDAVARGERLRAEHGAAGGDHGIEREQAEAGVEVPGGRHVGEREQAGRDHVRTGQEP